MNMTESAHLTPGGLLARRVREARQRRRLTQAGLAERMTDLGRPTDRTTVIKIEAGRTRSENVPVGELLALSAALGLSPLHLLVPAEGEATIDVTPSVTLAAAEMKTWVRGGPLPDRYLTVEDLRAFVSEMPESDLLAVLQARRNRDVPQLAQMFMPPLTEGDAQLAREQARHPREENSDGNA